MKLLTERDAVKKALEYYDLHPLGMVTRLKELDPEKATLYDIEEATGFKKVWLYRCEECINLCSEIVELGITIKYEQNPVHICLDCLKKAVCMFDGGL